MADENRSERQQQTIHRIHRIQGQLSGLERMIEAGSTCEEIVIQGRAVEKSAASLIEHVVGGFLLHQIRPLMETNPDEAIIQVKRIFELINK